MRAGDAALDRLKRARSLAEKVSGNPEAALVRARAALDAREFAEARTALSPLLDERPSRRVCLLMAELEDSETHDRGRARAWLARAVAAPRDPAWVADGIISDVWQPASPVTGRLDAFVWTVPQENLAAPDSRLLDAEMLDDAGIEPATAPLIVEHAEVEESPEAAPLAPEPVAEAVPEPAVEPMPAEADAPKADASKAPGKTVPPPRPMPEIVLPLARAPDDPGPDAEDEEDMPRPVPAAHGGT
jgi:HemY protein